MRGRQIGLVLIAAVVMAVAYWHVDVFAAVSGPSANGAVPNATGSSAVAKLPSDVPQPSLAGKGPPALTVKTAIATAGTLHFHRQTVGWLASPASINLTSPQQGIVAELVAKEGDVLKKGDLVAKLDDRVAQSAVGKDRAQLEKDQVLLGQATQNLSRAQTLVSKGAGTQQAMDDAKAAQGTAASTIDLDNASLAADQVALSNTEVRAPFEGRVGAYQVAVGSLIQPGGSIATITQMSPLQAKFSLPEGDLTAVRKAIGNGQASITVAPTTSSSSAVAGTIDFIDSVVDQASGTFKARATISNGDLALWPGESVTVVADLSETPGVAMVPIQAVQPTTSGSVVYVVTTDQTIEVRPVTVAGTEGDQAGIAAGLKSGEHVVIEGQVALAKGTKVAEAPGPFADSLPSKGVK
jgi:multidrug efflux system membrane fusion protein